MVEFARHYAGQTAVLAWFQIRKLLAGEQQIWSFDFGGAGYQRVERDPYEQAVRRTTLFRPTVDL